MSFDLHSIEAKLELLDWREREFETISSQLEKAYPELLSAILTHVDSMRLSSVAWTHANPKPLAQTLIAPWADEQSRIGVNRAEGRLKEVLDGLATDSDLRNHLSAALPALAGAGIIAASVAALPSLVTFATVTTTTLLISTTTVVSVPTLLIGGSVLAVLSATGVKTLDHANSKTRAQLVRRIAAMAQTAIFGQGLPPDARCLVNDLQAMVLQAGRNTLDEAA